MKIDHMCRVHFTWAEIREMMAEELECRANDYTYSNKEFGRFEDMAQAARSEHSTIERDADDKGLTLIIDGVAYTED